MKLLKIIVKLLQVNFWRLTRELKRRIQNSRMNWKNPNRLITLKIQLASSLSNRFNPKDYSHNLHLVLTLAQAISSKFKIPHQQFLEAIHPYLANQAMCNLTLLKEEDYLGLSLINSKNKNRCQLKVEQDYLDLTQNNSNNSQLKVQVQDYLDHRYHHKIKIKRIKMLLLITRMLNNDFIILN